MSSASRTFIADTLGKASVTARSSANSAVGSAWAVASWVCGAASNAPGAKMMVKLICIVPHSMWRRLAIRAVTSRPSTLTVKVSPTWMPKPAASSAENEINGGPA